MLSLCEATIVASRGLSGPAMGSLREERSAILAFVVVNRPK